MRRILTFAILFLVSTLACNLFNRVTPIPTTATLPAQPVSTRAPIRTSTTVPLRTQVSTSQVTSIITQEEPTKTPYPTSVLDTQMEDEINRIQSQVVQERGLQPKVQVPVVLLTSSELHSNVVNDFLVDYTDEDIKDDIYELSSVGLLDPGFDLKTLYTNLLSEQIAGYYDNDVKEMFLVSDQGFNGPEHLTYSHEFTHVLQDQNYDIKNGLKYDDDYCEKDTEYCAAVQALIEGDATLSEYTWYQYYATTTDQQQVIQYYNSLKSPIYDSAPAFLKDDFVFPYNQGLSFVQALHDQGGWQAVDAAFKDPPVSTEQILHPSLYPSDTPIPVELPDVTSAMGTGWREVTRNQMGEWYTYLILARGADPNSRLDDTTAQTASAGWGGDEYLVMHNDTSNTTAFVMKTVWDTSDDASQFSSALQKSLNSRFKLQATQQGNTFTWTFTGGYSSLVLSGSTTIWIVTPDAATAQTISGVVQP
ncbi:MAG TPA: hypothetical protein VLD65_07450 [Anaerolineales bacterium]|nr:hypothetical protein [Anaerolineales bacterium]